MSTHVYVVRKSERREGAVTVGIYASERGATIAAESEVAAQPAWTHPWERRGNAMWVSNGRIRRIWWDRHEVEP